MWPPAVMALLPLWLHSFSTSDENILKVPTTSGTVWEQRSPKTKVCRTRSRSGSWSLGGSTWPESWRRSTPWGNTEPWRNATTRNETVRNKESFIPVTKPDKHEEKVYNLFQSDWTAGWNGVLSRPNTKNCSSLKGFIPEKTTRSIKKTNCPWNTVLELCPWRSVLLGGESVTVSQVDSADRAGGVILSGGEQWSIQILSAFNLSIIESNNSPRHRER